MTGSKPSRQRRVGPAEAVSAAVAVGRGRRGPRAAAVLCVGMALVARAPQAWAAKDDIDLVAADGGRDDATRYASIDWRSGSDA
jgi:hypothetical protein